MIRSRRVGRGRCPDRSRRRSGLRGGRCGEAEPHAAQKHDIDRDSPNASACDAKLARRPRSASRNAALREPVADWFLCLRGFEMLDSVHDGLNLDSVRSLNGTKVLRALRKARATPNQATARRTCVRATACSGEDTPRFERYRRKAAVGAKTRGWPATPVSAQACCSISSRGRRLLRAKQSLRQARGQTKPRALARHMPCGWRPHQQENP